MSALTIPEAASLPALVRAAANKIANAETAAEILEARELAGVAYDTAKRAARLAKAKSAHDEIISAVYRAQADALEIESMAKRRLADEYDAAQERGEVASHGQPSSSMKEGLATAADIGLTHKEIHEARQIRNAERDDPGIVRRTLDQRLASGQEPNKSALREAVIEAARQGIARPFMATGRANPEYVDDPAFKMLLRIVGPCRAMIEQVERGEISIEGSLKGFLDDGQRERAIREVSLARDFLTSFLEAANAH
ncbi:MULTISPECIES: hypothetical protein [unclassified Blastomonas]|uniref:hypothetical protein n=1 Tax=unclassified Blastomonas TaxID=2626550 RepID=UPI000824C9AB|nr:MULTISPECIES: hypothetical protein [unclassified Blastomonas]